MGTVFRDTKTGKITGYSKKQKAKTPQEVYVKRPDSTGVKVVKVDVKATEAAKKIAKKAVERAERITLATQFRKTFERDTTTTAGIKRYGVVDVESKESRLASPYESLSVQQQIEKQKPVSAPKKTVEQLRKEEGVKQIYLSDVAGEVQPVFVTRETVIKPKPKYTPEGRIEEKQKDYSGLAKAFGKEFVAGFALREQPSKYSPARGLRQTGFDIAYTGGIVTGIATLSPGLYSKPAAAIARQVYRSPRLYGAVEKVAAIAKTPIGKTVQRFAVGAYGITKGTEAVSSYLTEGTTGVARTGFEVIRTTAGIGGITKGLEKGFARSIKETTYKVKGKSAIKTKIQDESFESAIATRGKINEVFEGKARREIPIKDITLQEGRIKEISRIERGIGTPFGKKRFIDVDYAITGQARSATALSTKPEQYTYTTSVIDSRIAGRSLDLEDLNIRGRQVTYGISQTFGPQFKVKDISGVRGKQSFTEFKQDLGITASRARYLATPEESFIKGTIAGLEGRVGFDIGVTETIKVIKGPSTGYDFSAGVGLRTAKIESRLSKDVLSIFKTEQPTLPKAPVKIPDKPKTDTTLKIKPSKEERVSDILIPSVEARTTDKPTTITKVLRDIISKERAGVFPRTDIIIKQDPITKATQRRLTTTKPDTKIDTQFKFISKVTPIQEPITTTQERVTQKTAIFTTPLIPTGTGRTTGFTPEPIRPFLVAGIPTLPEAKQKKRKTKEKRVKAAGAYAPSFEAIAFDITAKEIPQDYTTGLFVRPKIKRRKR